MKKTDWIILLATAAYSILFYEQLAGLNFLLFTLLITGFYYWQNPTLLKNKQWLLTALLTLVSGIMVFVHSSWLALWANGISLMLLSAVSCNQQSSVIFNLAFSLYSLLGSWIFFMLHLNDSNKNRGDLNVVKGKKQLLTYLIPLLLIVIFFLIYRSANPLFQKYTEKINLNFISFAWCIFTFCGFFIIWGLIRHQRISFVDIWENNQPLTLNPHKTYSSSKWNEKTSATLLFFVLNVMLLLINLLDINFLYLNQGMPEGINHADFVHNGVGMLILSIVMAISILLYFFRGGLNFEEKNQNLKRLVYFWIAQNVLMVISTMVRNNLYIQEYTLTYRRIGVYVWLFMAAIGLISTALKIMKARSNWYLFRVNALAAYLVLVVASCIDWDRFLTVYNIHHTKSLAALDKTYLLSLSESNIPDLLIIKDFKDINKDSSWHYRWYDSDSELSFSSGSRLVNNSGNIDYKLYEYLQRTCDMGWRSWSIRQYTIYKAVATLNRMRKIKVLDLGGHSIKNLKPLAIVNQAEELNLSHSGLCTLEEIRLFPCLKKLNLSFSNSLTNIKELKSLPALNSLNVENTRLNSITPIFDKVFLKELNLKNCGVHELRGLEKLSKLEYLWLSAVQEKDILYLKQLKALKTLTVSACGADIVEKLKAALPNCKVNQDTIQANNNR